MKEVITVELDKTDVEQAIEDMLQKHGYKVENFEFKAKSLAFSAGEEFTGAVVTVTKKS